MLPFAIAVGGSECNPRFFQLLFESQSSSLVTELFMGEMSKPLRGIPSNAFLLPGVLLIAMPPQDGVFALILC